MNEDELRLAYLQWIEDETRNKFDINNLRGGIKLALDNLVQQDPFQWGVTSEKLSDMQQSFSNTGDLPTYVYKWIKPYYKLKSL